MTQRGRSLKRMMGALSIVGLLTASACSTSEESPTPSPTPVASAPTERQAPASTPVPPPAPGDISSTLEPTKVERRKPVALTKPGTAADGVIISLRAVRGINAKAVGPGEVAGPALRVDVLIRNTTSSPLDLGAAAVSLTDEDGGPGAPMTGPPATGLATELAANSEASAVYVFAVSKRLRDPVTIEVSVSGSVPTAVFRGKADD